MPQLTAGEECQLSAKILSSFADPRQGAITAPFINSAMGIAIFKGDVGVAIVRLKTGDWSAPCAITCQNPNSTIQPSQDMVLLFMSEKAIFSLVGQTPFVFNETHKFAAGPLFGSALNLDNGVDVYCYIRFNNGFTPAELISYHMNGWSVKEDNVRHARWHGKNATWFDVLTNKISVDRSSVGNALYLVLNLASSGGNATGKNYAKIDDWVQSKPTVQSTINSTFQGQHFNQQNLYQTQQPQQQFDQQNFYQTQQPQHQFDQQTTYHNQGQNQQFNAQALYQLQLQEQQRQYQLMQQNSGQQMMMTPPMQQQFGNVQPLQQGFIMQNTFQQQPQQPQQPNSQFYYNQQFQGQQNGQFQG